MLNEKLRVVIRAGAVTVVYANVTIRDLRYESRFDDRLKDLRSAIRQQIPGVKFYTRENEQQYIFAIPRGLPENLRHKLAEIFGSTPLAIEDEWNFAAEGLNA